MHTQLGEKDASNHEANQNFAPAMRDGTAKCAGCGVVGGWPVLQAFPNLTDAPRCRHCRQAFMDQKYGV